ncbi:MAG TPA: DUF1281 domain-containing protein [Scandinavium sp.]|jgi:hypothetical protein
MFSWCQNRLEVTGKSVCIEVMQSWVAGTEKPRYRHAIRQAIRLFLAGCAGILRPVKTTTFDIYPLLTEAGTGSQTAPNQAFQHFLELLGVDAWLDDTTVSRMEKIYLQSGLGSLKWDDIPFGARQTITQLMMLHYVDWFGLTSASAQIDPAERWEWLGTMPVTTCTCDMLMVIPSRLATELNGNSGLFRGISLSSELYMQLFDMEYPAGHQAVCSHDGINSLSLTFNTPWYPPSAEVVGEMSQLFDCEIRHYWKSQDVGYSGYNCFDKGYHVDSGPYPEEMLQLSSEEGARLYLVTPEMASLVTVLPASGA